MQHITSINVANSWQHEQQNLITNIDDLLAHLDLSHIKKNLYVPKQFKLRVPKAFVNKMQKGEPNDPLLKQVLPLKDEQLVVAGFVADPLAENLQRPVKGLLHKYQSRVLLTVTGACAIHCRYCFRQHFDYAANMPTTRQQDTIATYIQSHPDIHEVILSGGDPLSLSNRKLFAWLDVLESLPQIKTIRLHTRLPVVIPQRLETELLERLKRSRCQVVMVIHANHANELDDTTLRYLSQLKTFGVLALNQTVLLKGVNDDADTLATLSERLFAADVLPYYLHVLDKVAGAAHFWVSKPQAVAIYWQLLAKTAGYLVPKLVEELPHKPFKTPVDLYGLNTQKSCYPNPKK